MIPRGSFLDGVVNGTAVGSVNLVFVRYGGPVVVEAPPTGDRVAVTVPLGPMGVRTHVERTVAGEGFVLADDRPTVMRPDPYAGAIVIAADRALLDRAVTRLTGVQRAPVEFGPRWTTSAMPTRMLDSTWRHVGEMLAAIPSAPPAAVRALESMLVDAILLGTPHSHSALLAAPRPETPGHADRIRAWLEEHHAEPVTVADVAAAVGLSVAPGAGGRPQLVRHDSDVAPARDPADARPRAPALRCGAERVGGGCRSGLHPPRALRGRVPRPLRRASLGDPLTGRSLRRGGRQPKLRHAGEAGAATQPVATVSERPSAARCGRARPTLT